MYSQFTHTNQFIHILQETSQLWINNMASLQAEQQKSREENDRSLSELEERYRNQITSLQDHLHRVVSESDQKDTLISQVSSFLPPYDYIQYIHYIFKSHRNTVTVPYSARVGCIG